MMRLFFASSIVFFSSIAKRHFPIFACSRKQNPAKFYFSMAETPQGVFFKEFLPDQE